MSFMSIIFLPILVVARHSDGHSGGGMSQLWTFCWWRATVMALLVVECHKVMDVLFMAIMVVARHSNGHFGGGM